MNTKIATMMLVAFLSACDDGSNTSGASASSGTGGAGTGGADACATNECVAAEYVDGECIYTAEPSTQSCMVDGQVATCDGDSACGGHQCKYYSDCPDKDGATWRCVGENEAPKDGVDFHTCKYTSNATTSCHIATNGHGAEVCNETAPGATTWICNIGDVTPLTMKGCVISDLGSQVTWCCDQ